MKYTPDSIHNLIADLQSDDDSTRALAAFALVLLGEPAVDPLVDLLSHDESDVRMRAAWSLGVIGVPALPRLTQLIESEDVRLRTEAIRILGVIGEARTLNHLLHALTDPHREIAARAARAIGRVGDLRAYHSLITALHHPEADVRYEACRALADLRQPDAILALEEVVAKDTGHTTWGGSVAEVARRSVQDLQRVAARADLRAELERITQLMRQHTQNDPPA